MATSVDAALAEIAASLATLSPQLEGLRDFDRLNLGADARQEIGVSMAAYARREQLLKTAQGVLQQLLADGHPGMSVRDIGAIAYADLVENAGTIAAALAQFSGGEVATELRTTAAPPQKKN